MSECAAPSTACPMTERERDLMWKRLDDLAATVFALDKTQAVQQQELAQIAGRVEEIGRLNQESLSRLTVLVERIDLRTRQERDDVIRMEAAKRASKMWVGYIISVLGLLAAMGYGIHAYAMPPVTSEKRPQSWERIEGGVGYE